MRVHESLVRVRYAETDVMGFVYHSNYFVWFEVGRVEYLRAAGFTYRDLEAEEGIHLPVLECSCRFVHPARYDDPVKIRTSVRDVTRVRMTFDYQAAHAESGELLAEGHTTHVFTDRDGKPKRLAATSPLWEHLRDRLAFLSEPAVPETGML